MLLIVYFFACMRTCETFALNQNKVTLQTQLTQLREAIGREHGGMAESG